MFGPKTQTRNCAAYFSFHMHKESKMLLFIAWHCVWMHVALLIVPKACDWIMKNLWKCQAGNLSFGKWNKGKRV